MSDQHASQGDDQDDEDDDITTEMVIDGLRRARLFAALYRFNGDANRSNQLAARRVASIESIGDACCATIHGHGIAHDSYIELCRKGQLPPMRLGLPAACDGGARGGA